jgi:exoribonuclease-2
VISAFDAAYTAYNGYQQGIERFWTLQWVAQQGLTDIDASVMKDGLVRADIVPLVFRLPGTDNLPRGSRVRARVNGMDLLTLELHATLAARLDEAPPAADADEAAAEDDDAEPTGALQLAIALEDADSATPATVAADPV